MDAKQHHQLQELTEDLDLQVDQQYIQQKQSAFGPTFENQLHDDVEYVVDILSGGNRGGDWDVAKEVRVINVLGGTELDFTEARFSNTVTFLKINCVLGGVKIFVPEGVRIKSKLINVLSTFHNRAPHTNRPDAPTLIIEGFMFLGGVEIKLKKAFKQRLLEFGNSIKTFLSPDTNDKVRSIKR